MPHRPLRLAVLLSGSGSTLQNLIDRCADGRLDAEVRLVVSSRPGVRGLERAEAAGISTVVVERKRYEGALEAFSHALFSRIDPAEIDLIVLAGWMTIFVLPDVWLKGRVVNVHPSLLPAFGGRGMFGRRVHEAVLAHGCKVTGCTVHLVNNEVDGAIATITNHNPDKHNAFTDAMDAQLFEILAQLRTRPDIRAVIWQGEGKSFSSGRDVGSIGTNISELTHHELMRRGHRGIQQLWTSTRRSSWRAKAG